MSDSNSLSALLANPDARTGDAAKAARTMAQLSHPDRLRVLCLLIDEGELSVAQLLERVDLSPSALSQHLTKMREDGLVGARRESKNMIYWIARDDIRQILHLLYKLYCSADK